MLASKLGGYGASVLNALVGETVLGIENWELRIESLLRADGFHLQCSCGTGVDAACAGAAGMVAVVEGKVPVVVVEGGCCDDGTKEKLAAGMRNNELVIAPDEAQSCLYGPVAFEDGHGVDTYKFGGL